MKESGFEKLKSYGHIIPVILAIAVIPLVMRFDVYDSQLAEHSWLSTSSLRGDLFIYGKQKAVLLLNIVLVVGLIYLWLKKQIPKNKPFIALGIYAILIILSTLFSVNSYVSWNGYPELMETVFVLLGYCMICFYTYAAIKTEKQVKIIMFAFFIGMGILCFLGTLEYFGMDFFMTDFGKWLTFPKEHSGYAEGLESTTTNVVSTLYNSNYMGVYCSIIIPILFMLGASVKEKKHIVLYLILAILAGFCVIGSDAKTATIILVPFFVFFLFYYGRKWKKTVWIAMVVGLLFGTGLLISQTEGSVLTKVLKLMKLGYTPTVTYPLQDITLNDEDFTITYKGNVLTVWYQKESDDSYILHAQDEEKNSIDISYEEENDNYIIKDARYQGLTFQRVQNVPFAYGVKSQSYTFDIYYSESAQSYYYKNHFNRYTKLYSSESIDLPVFHLMGGFTKRDFIWRKSLPILKNTLFLGSGPDTYALMFPQYDYLAMEQEYAVPNVYITKPHNIYLQIGIQTGVLSLISYIALYVGYFAECVKVYRKRELNTFVERSGMAIFIALICYTISGLINDSSIGVSIVAWTLLGLGFACNKLIKNSVESVKVELLDKIDKPDKMQLYIKGLVGLVLGLGVIAGHLLLTINDEEYRDGRAKFTADIQKDLNALIEDISYRAVMNQYWTFQNGESVSHDAYVENSTDNTNPVYFDVRLANGEVIYTSEIIEVGDRLDTIVLEKNLEAGEYGALVTYYILSENGTELATGNVQIVITVLE